MIITEFPHLPILPREMINKYKIPKIKLKFNQSDINTFNDVYQWMRHYDSFNEWTRVYPTPSGAIPTAKDKLIMPAYMVTVSRTSIELIILCIEGQYRFIIGAPKDDTVGITGLQAYNAFVKVCKEFGVDLDKFAITNGKEVKATIEKPMVGYSDFINNTGLHGKDVDIPNCHHLDLNSSYMASIAEAYPELQPPINHIYTHRKDSADKNQLNKAILTHTYGFLQSQYCVVNGHGYAHADMSKVAIARNNLKLKLFTKFLEESGRTVLLYNADGIWYTGEQYHDQFENDYLGCWKHDYVDCVLNIKSPGAYQFKGTRTKDNTYIDCKAVVRGVSSYDMVVDRDNWKWNDIYKGHILSYTFDEERGIIYNESEDDE